MTPNDLSLKLIRYTIYKKWGRPPRYTGYSSEGVLVAWARKHKRSLTHAKFIAYSLNNAAELLANFIGDSGK